MNINDIRERVRETMHPLRGVDSPDYALWDGYWTKAGASLPEYYIVFFLLVDLLEFNHVGQFEKAAWGIPIDLDGYVLSIEYRKRGRGIVDYHGDDPEPHAEQVVSLIEKGLPVARPYFDRRAEEAAKGSEMNVLNRAPDLYQRFEYLLDLYEAKHSAYQAHKDEIVETKVNGVMVYSNEVGAHLGGRGAMAGHERGRELLQLDRARVHPSRNPAGSMCDR